MNVEPCTQIIKSQGDKTISQIISILLTFQYFNTFLEEDRKGKVGFTIQEVPKKN